MATGCFRTMSTISIVVFFLSAVVIDLDATSDLLFVAKKTGLYYMNLLDPQYPITYIPVKGVTNAASLDYDPLNEYVYWSDLDLNKISRARLNGKDQSVIINMVNQPTSVVLDIHERYLYWANSGDGTIERSYTDGTERKVVIGQGLDEPNTIVLDHLNGYIYWTDLLHIGRAKLDSPEIEILKTNTSHYPKGLTINSSKGIIYWTEFMMGNSAGYWINVANANGSDPEKLWRFGVTDIDVYGEFLCFSSILGLSMVNTSLPQITARSVISLINSYIRSMSAFRTNSGQNILIVGSNGRVREISLDLEQDLGRTIVWKSGDVYYVDYDPQQDKIYWSNFNAIYSVNRNGSDLKTLLTGDWWWSADLAVSWYTKELFFTNNVNNTVERITLMGEDRTTIIENTLSVSSIAVDMINNHIYWTEGRSIRRATFSGDEQVEIVGNLVKPYGIIVDVGNQLMYWANDDDDDADFIYVANMDGSNIEKKSLTRGPSHLQNRHFFTLSGEIIYWIDANSTLQKMNTSRWTDNSVVIFSEMDYTGIRVVQVKTCKNNPCKNGADCIKFKDSIGCRCPPGYSGSLCELFTVNVTVYSVSPLFGPVAGGTQVIIRGEDFPSEAVKVQIGLATECNITFANSTTIIAVTGQVDLSYADTEHSISVIFNSNTSATLEIKFRFKRNPKITSIHPLTTLRVGGTKLIVTGENLDAVVRPLLRVTRLLRTVKSTDGTIINELVEIYHERCSPVNQSVLICITPNMNISQTTNTGGRRRRDITEYNLKAKEDLFIQTRRVKREADRTETETIYIGLIFDGFVKYQNLSKSINTESYGILTIVEPPRFGTHDANRVFVFRRGQLLDIKGQDVDNVLKEDYEVEVADSRCNVSKISNTYLYCMPPQTEPSLESKESSHSYPIVVRIGQNIKLTAGNLKYKSNSNIYIGIGCGAVILLALIIVIVVCYNKRHREKPQHRGPGNDKSISHTIELPPVNNDYA